MIFIHNSILYMLRLTFILLLIIIVPAMSKQDTVKIHTESLAPGSQKKDTTLARIMIAEIIHGKDIPNSIIRKTDAAMAIALGAADKFIYVSLKERDSIAKKLKDANIDPTAFSVGQQLKAEALFFLRVNKLGNLLRVEISAKAGKDYNQSVSGIGLAMLRYRDSLGTIVYDPTLVEAIQRAMCEVTGDSSLYQKAESPEYQVAPAEPLCFISFQLEDTQIKSLWPIFQGKEVNSFYALEVLFEAASLQQTKYLPIDQVTRDSVYVLKGLRGTENFNLPNKEELSLLYSVGFAYCINGKCKKTLEGADISLTLQQIKPDGTLIKIKKLTAGLSEDTLEAFKKTASALVKKLLQ